MRTRAKWSAAALALLVTVAACEDDDVFFVPDGEPAPPRALDVRYYAGEVTLTWELHPQWDGESFLVYGKRVEDADFFLIAEVTSCTEGFCAYTDLNVAPDQSYEYFVSALDPNTGIEADSEFIVEVFVPRPVPPPVPGSVEVVALDGTNYVRWGSGARSADDFSFYRVYLETQDGSFLLGETDSEGFLDELAQNGVTSSYFVTSVDDQGHESTGSQTAEGTPRPDFTGEVLYVHEDRPELSGFRFQDDDATDPVVGGTDPGRDFRLELDAGGWWLVPDEGTEIYRDAFATTALKCGPASDAGCTDVVRASTNSADYTDQDVGLIPQTTYVLRYRFDGQWRYAALRVVLLGFDQNDDGLMIFDWAHQIQTGNPNLTHVIPVPPRNAQ